MIADSALAARLTEELTRAIHDKTEALVQSPNEGLAGEIRGLKDALALLGATEAKLSQRRT